MSAYVVSKPGCADFEAATRDPSANEEPMDFRVLAVDDEADFIETLVKRFTYRGIPVAAAASGPEALAALAAGPYDVVILDMRMPGMDGIAVLREIKKRHPLVEVIMLTGHASVEAGMQGMSLGAYDYVLKPVDFGELLEKARKASERKKLNEARSQA
jgi:two-component system, OmpR family, response regulator